MNPTGFYRIFFLSSLIVQSVRIISLTYLLISKFRLYTSQLNLAGRFFVAWVMVKKKKKIALLKNCNVENLTELSQTQTTISLILKEHSLYLSPAC